MFKIKLKTGEVINANDSKVVNLSKSKVDESSWNVFDKIDFNKSGKIDQFEFDRFSLQTNSTSSNIASTLRQELYAKSNKNVVFAVNLINKNNIANVLNDFELNTNNAELNISYGYNNNYGRGTKRDAAIFPLTLTQGIYNNTSISKEDRKKMHAKIQD